MRELTEGILGLPEASEELFEQALTHSSIGDRPNYERLEFLGDAVLKHVVSEWIFERFPDYSEGEMTKIRAKVVSDATLANVAKRLQLGSFLRLGGTEHRTGGKQKVGTLAASLEAVLAATYRVHGPDEIKRVVRTLWEEDVSTAAVAPGAENAKALLQEATQERFGTLPSYHMVGGSGPQHHYTFFVEVEVEGRILGRGQGASKKAAEQAAAAEALEVLGTMA